MKAEHKEALKAARQKMRELRAIRLEIGPYVVTADPFQFILRQDGCTEKYFQYMDGVINHILNEEIKAFSTPCVSQVKPAIDQATDRLLKSIHVSTAIEKVELARENIVK